MITKTTIPFNQTKKPISGYTAIQLNFNLYDEHLREAAYLKFVKTLKTIRITVIARVDHTLLIHNSDLEVFKRQYRMFKSQCIKNRNNTQVNCACTDKTMCRILDCDCCCHDEDKFFNSSYHLSEKDRIRMSLQHYGPHELISKSLLHYIRPKLNATEQDHLCHLCKTYHTTNCKNCEMYIEKTST